MMLVFAHFETSLPRHLRSNLERTASLFPDLKIVLITDLKNLRPIKGVIFEEFVNTAAGRLLEVGLSHPMEFRRKFWMTTLLRLVAVSEYVKKENKPIIHIESDVIVSEDFPLDVFESLDSEIAYPLVSPGLGVASTLFLRDGKAADNFLEFIYETVNDNPKTTDMKILFDYACKFDSRVTVLPTSTRTPEAFQNLTSGITSQSLTNHIEHFGGIFDTVDIGFYLLGEDARNHRGIRKLRTLDPLSFVNLRFLDFAFSEKRNFVNIKEQTSGTEYPLYSLHIHSKDLAAFKLSVGPGRLRKAIESQDKAPSNSFRPIIFLGLAIKYILKKMRYQ